MSDIYLSVAGPARLSNYKVNVAPESKCLPTPGVDPGQPYSSISFTSQIICETIAIKFSKRHIKHCCGEMMPSRKLAACIRTQTGHDLQYAELGP